MNHAKPFTGESLRNTGIQLSLDHAEIKHEGWQEKAMNLLEKFLIGRRKFMCEDFRAFCEKNGLPIPPSKRAFGAIILKAVKQGMIKRVGFGNTKNPKAHLTPASIWEPINCLKISYKKS